MKHILASLAAAGLAACANPGPTQEPPPRLAAADLGLAADASTPEVAPDWWRRFGDPALDALVARALEGTPSLQAAAARVARADAAVLNSRAAELPGAALSFDATRQRYTEHGLVPPPIAGSTRTSANLQLGATWELDFFGRHDAALQAALGQQRAARIEQQAARTLLATQITRAWLQLARGFALREVVQRSLEQRNQMLALTRQREQAGLDTRAELRQAEGLPPELRGQTEALDEQIALTRHQLAALSGLPPQALAEARPRLAALPPPVLPPVLGADLLGRRADVAAARARADAALQDVAGARAQFMPDINLVGFVGLSSLGLDRLLNLGSRQLGVGPALRLPIFDSGRLKANLQARQADVDAAVAAYNAAVLEALHEVADALASWQSVQRQQAEQARAQASAESAYELAQQRYRAGLGGYLNVLVVEGSVLAQRRQQVDLQARALDAQALLMRALGGGWQDTDATPALAGTATTKEQP